MLCLELNGYTFTTNLVIFCSVTVFKMINV